MTVYIHALREEGDITGEGFFFFWGDFYPRPPRGGRPSLLSVDSPKGSISIHALREEGDAKLTQNTADIAKFLSTPSARRATTEDTHQTGETYDFYPRPPRGGRLLQHLPCGQGLHFYPRPPRGGRRAKVAKLQHKGVISIHALREEGDSVS